MSDPLVTLTQAKQHLRLSGTAEDDDLELKLAQAQSTILEYLARPDVTWTATIAAWTPDTVPYHVKAAILLQLGELYRFRGDDLEVPTREPGFLTDGIRALLARLRDPVIA